MSYVVSFPRQIDNDIRLCPDVGIWSPDNLKSSKYQHPMTLSFWFLLLEMSACLSVSLLVHHLNITTTIGLISMKHCTRIYDSQRMKPIDFSDPLTFSQALPTG